MKNLVVGILAVILVVSVTAQATVTTLNYYRMGESDPTAVVGNTLVTNPGTQNEMGTGDGSGSKDLWVIVGNTTWSADTPNADLLRFGASTFSIDSWGGNAPYYTGYVHDNGDGVSSATDLIGMEVWVKSDLASQVGWVALMGAHGNGPYNGFGIYQNGTSWQLHAPGVEVQTFGTVTVDEWTHLAVVYDNAATAGGTGTLYLNGVAVANTVSTPIAATAGANNGVSHIVVGAESVNTGGLYSFDGKIDEFRIFTIANSGDFEASDLNYVPEPTTMVLLSIGGLMALGRKRQ